MCFGEPADHLRFSIGLRPAVFNLMKILEEVPKQIRIAGASLCQGSVDNIRHVLRKGEFRTLDFAQERAETGTRRFEALTMALSISFQRKGLSVTILAPVAWASTSSSRNSA